VSLLYIQGYIFRAIVFYSAVLLAILFIERAWRSNSLFQSTATSKL
jgi:hypothetical protein